MLILLPVSLAWDGDGGEGGRESESHVAESTGWEAVRRRASGPD